MILPTKHLSQERALLTIGGQILRHLSRSKTTSALWEELTTERAQTTEPPSLHYDEFVLTLDLLFLMGAIELHEGVLARRTR